MEIPECPICLEPYDLVSRVPVTLTNCGHSICNADLAILPGHSCPICKVGIKSKPIKNYALMQLLESQGKTPTMVKCRPHSLAFEFWCDECSCLCCPKCFLNTHKGHTMQGLEEAMEQNRELIEELFELGQTALEEMNRQVQHCHDRRTLAGAAKVALKRDIDGHCDMLIKAIEQRRQDLLLLMERHPALSSSHQDGEERARVERQEALSLQLREARALWERRDVRLLADAPILTDELNSIIAGSSETSRGEAPPCMMWRARFADPSPLLEQIRGLGGLHSSVNTGTCSVATGEGLQRAVVGGSAVFSVTTYDASGARRRTGGEEVVMACEEAGGFEYRVADGGDGTYEVTYRVEGKGPVEGQCSFDLHVRVGAQPVLGSPWKVQLLPAFQGLHAGTVGTRGTGMLQFQGPAAIAVDASCIYVADGDNHRIQVLEASTGTFVAQMGKPELDLRTTYGVAVDDTCLYVAERDFHRVTVLDKATGRFKRTLGEGSGMKEPLAVAVYGNLVAVSDTVKHRVMLFDKVGGRLIRTIGPALVRATGGNAKAPQEQMISTCDVAFDSTGLLYVTDREGSRILVFQPSNGTFLRQFGSHGTGPGQFNHVNRVFVTEDRVYGTDRYGARVLMFDKATGAFMSTFGTGILERPNGVAMVKGRLLVGDFARNCLQVFT